MTGCAYCRYPPLEPQDALEALLEQSDQRRIQIFTEATRETLQLLSIDCQKKLCFLALSMGITNLLCRRIGGWPTADTRYGE
jgi:hypothetical protein